MVTPTAGRETLFRERPPQDVLPARERDGDRGASFLTWNLRRRFGAGWPAAWIDLTLRRMDAWGLNTVANWSDERLWEAKRKPYVIPLESWLTAVSYLGLPDVYSEAFAREADDPLDERHAAALRPGLRRVEDDDVAVGVGAPAG